MNHIAAPQGCKRTNRMEHSQIEKRRREKINDRLATLRKIVPACVMELEVRQQELDELIRMSASDFTSRSSCSLASKHKRKLRRAARKREMHDFESSERRNDMTLNKLEILNHTVAYIQQLEIRLMELESNFAWLDQNKFSACNQQRQLFIVGNNQFGNDIGTQNIQVSRRFSNTPEIQRMKTASEDIYTYQQDGSDKPHSNALSSSTASPPTANVCNTSPFFTLPFPPQTRVGNEICVPSLHAPSFAAINTQHLDFQHKLYGDLTLRGRHSASSALTASQAQGDICKPPFTKTPQSKFYISPAIETVFSKSMEYFWRGYANKPHEESGMLLSLGRYSKLSNLRNSSNDHSSRI